MNWLPACKSNIFRAYAPIARPTSLQPAPTPTGSFSGNGRTHGRNPSHGTNPRTPTVRHSDWIFFSTRISSFHKPLLKMNISASSIQSARGASVHAHNCYCSFQWYVKVNTLELGYHILTSYFLFIHSWLWVNMLFVFTREGKNCAKVTHRRFIFWITPLLLPTENKSACTIVFAHNEEQRENEEIAKVENKKTYNYERNSITASTTTSRRRYDKLADVYSMSGDTVDFARNMGEYIDDRCPR